MSKLLVILGPTGTGKTKLGLSLLNSIKGEIISFDSRQIYKQLDYTTNKIQPDEMHGIKGIRREDGYWLQEGCRINGYDLISPSEQYNVSDYVRFAEGEIQRIHHSNELPILVGGTGFYLSAVLGESGFSSVMPDMELRSMLQLMSLGELQNRLQSIDNSAYQTMTRSEICNPRRLIRYIEIAQSVGGIKDAIVYSELKNRIQDREIGVLKIGLTSDRERLYERADDWSNQLVNTDCWHSEIKLLIENQLETSHISDGMVFSSLINLVLGWLSKAEVVEDLKGSMHHYIRRQLTWFRQTSDVVWFDVSQDGWQMQVVDKVVKWYDERI